MPLSRRSPKRGQLEGGVTAGARGSRSLEAEFTTSSRSPPTSPGQTRAASAGILGNPAPRRHRLTLKRVPLSRRSPKRGQLEGGVTAGARGSRSLEAEFTTSSRSPPTSPGQTRAASAGILGNPAPRRHRSTLGRVPLSRRSPDRGQLGEGSPPVPEVAGASRRSSRQAVGATESQELDSEGSQEPPRSPSTLRDHCLEVRSIACHGHRTRVVNRSARATAIAGERDSERHDTRRVTVARRG